MQQQATVGAASSRDSSEYDIVICGGGLVGASLAVALSQLPLRIAVVEARAPTAQQQPSYDDRATAISYVSQRILAGLGLWEALAGAATPIRKVHVSERGRFGATWIGPEYTGGAPLGYVIVNRVFGAVLGRAMRESNVELLCPAIFESLQQNPEHVAVKIVMNGNEQQLRARLLIAADGADSRVRKALGIAARVHDYDQTAILANVTPQYAHENVAYERFTATGPLAVLPLDEKRCKIVLTARNADVDAILALDDREFLEQLQSRFGDRLGRFREPGARQAYPLRLVRAERQTAARALVMGNAAHSLHPVAAQGFNLSLRDAATLADVLADAVRAGEDIGNRATLGRYDKRRRRDQTLTVAMTDSLNRVLSSSFMPVAAARSFGKLALDLAPPVKRRFVRHNLGLTGNLPQLARGLKLKSF
jgi:2-octaprenyl-6-methoxyphenol hydroxylase